MGRLFDSVATKAEHHADLRAREEDLTPRGVVWAVLQHLVLELKREAPRTILDVCAGYGVWSSEAGRLWPMAKITAVELDGRKEDALGRWANEVVIGDWTEALRCRQYDLAIGNPHFSALTHEDPSQSMPARLLGSPMGAAVPSGAVVPKEHRRLSNLARVPAGGRVRRAWVGPLPRRREPRDR